MRTGLPGSVPRGELPAGLPGVRRESLPLACLAVLVNVAYLALLVYIAYVESIALAASCPGQRPALDGLSCGGGGRRPYARGSPCVRSSGLRSPGASCRRPPPGYVESRSPACPAVLVNVAYLALLVYIAYVESIALAASCPGQRPALGGLIVRGGAAHTLEAARAYGLPGSVPPG